jgi:CBS-domain-containing membrane protein
MLKAGRAQRVTIFIGESDQWNDQPVYLAILEHLRRHGAAGATVSRALAGFGAHSRAHLASVVRMSLDIPLVVSWVDHPDRVRRLLPRITEIVGGGLIIIDEVEVHHYAGEREGFPRVNVAEVMTREVVTVGPNDPVSQVAEKLLEHEFTALPVIDGDRTVVGIVSDTDLLRRADMKIRMSVKKALEPSARQPFIDQLRQSPLKVHEVMNRPVSTVSPDTSLATAARLMMDWRINRLPVTDRDGRLLGILGRHDLLRALALGAMPSRAASLPSGISGGAQAGRTLREIMLTRVVTASRETSLTELVGQLVNAVERVVVVIDGARHVVGVVTDTDLLRRLAPEMRPRLLAWFSRARDDDQILHALRGTTAADVMSSPVVTARADESPEAALLLAVDHGLKRLPVVDQNDELVGLVARRELLGAFVAPEPPDEVA